MLRATGKGKRRKIIVRNKQKEFKAKKINALKRKIQNYRTGGFSNLQPFGLEQKVIDVFKTFQVPTGPGSTNLLFDGLPYFIKVGSSQSTRIGSKIRITKIFIKGFWHLPKNGQVGATFINPDATTNFFGRGRAWLVLDTQCNSSKPVPAEVILKTDQACWCDGFRNTQYTQRYKVLATWEAALNGRSVTLAGDGAIAILGNMSVPFEKYINVDIPITYKSGDGDIGDLTENNIFLMAGSERGAIQLFCTVRLRYED
jgi:hypothetical protein